MKKTTRNRITQHDRVYLFFQDDRAGKIFVQAPERPIEVSRFEKDLEKLGSLYETGFREMKARIPELKTYLEQTPEC